MIEPVKLDVLKALSPGVCAMSEAGIDYVFLPGLKVTTGLETRTVDGLLCPMHHSGYSTRLFLSEPIPSRGQNWTMHTILSRSWHTWSWNHVPCSLGLAQIVSAHLRALR